MNNRVLAVLVLGIFALQILSGCTWFSNEDDYVDGFDESELVVPQIPSDPPHSIIERPQENESQLPPGFSYNLSWAMGEVYEKWGGFIRITCTNTGVNDIFVYRYGIVVDWSFPSQWIYEERNTLIPVGEQADLGLVYFSAPHPPGNYSYHVIISIMVKDNEHFELHNEESWYDNKTVHSREKIMYVTPVKEAENTKIVNNYKYYHDKVNDKVDFEDVNVLTLISDIKEKYPGEYNLYQILALFDFMINDLTYISDPQGRDYWATCSETLALGGGDCEDFSILFSSTLGALGGTPRIYLTQTHAFSAFYMGDASQKDDILTAIEEYYGTKPNYVIFVDDEGYWLAVDPAGTLYLGGLPADAEPALIPGNPSSFGFNFFDTSKIHAIDVQD